METEAAQVYSDILRSLQQTILNPSVSVLPPSPYPSQMSTFEKGVIAYQGPYPGHCDNVKVQLQGT